MQRGGGEDEEVIVAISPPPQFQDTPTQPPPVFADCLTDFASRISFDILNEAMVIATGELVLLHGPQDVQQHGGGPSSSHISPESSEEDLSSSSGGSNPLSTTTSWEFISKASSWSDLRCLHFQPEKNERTHTSPRRQPVQASKRSAVALTNPQSSYRRRPTIVLDKQENTKAEPMCPRVFEQTSIGKRSFVSISQRISPVPLSSTKNPATRSFSHEGSLRNNHQNQNYSQNTPLSSRTNLPANELSHNQHVPDIYSTPVDSIAPSNDVSCDRPVPAPRRSRIRDSRSVVLQNNPNWTNRNSSSDKRNDGGNSGGTEPCLRIQANNLPTEIPPQQSSYSKTHCEQTNTKYVNNDCTSTKRLDSEKNNNNGASSSGVNKLDAVCNSSITRAARRSRSVEIATCAVQESKDVNSTSQSTRNQSCVEFTQDSHDKPEKKWLGQSILNLFKRHKPRLKSENIMTSCISISSEAERDEAQEVSGVNVSRALPPTPSVSDVRVQSISVNNGAEQNEVLGDSFDSPPLHNQEASLGCIDFAASIEKVKDCGWYWGPLSSESAEDLLRGEPDGSFIVRDSSDAHYIFSLTFKLNGLVRHVRIEHDQGNFSFGPLTRFKAATIVDFVEKAVAHSRSGRYLFFLHRRPVLGPMRVQLLHPYSRFRHPRSLQHMCRFVILKSVRRDLLDTLPLPKPLQEYLNTAHYYFEQPEEKR